MKVREVDRDSGFVRVDRKQSVVSKEAAKQIVKEMKSKDSSLWGCGVRIPEDGQMAAIRTRVFRDISGDIRRDNEGLVFITKQQVCTTRGKIFASNAEMKRVIVGGKSRDSVISRIFHRVFSRRRAING